MSEDKRLTKQLTDYWSHICRGRALPPWEFFNAGAIEDIWKQCCVWQVETGGEGRKINQYTYEYVGRGLKGALGKDLTGMVFSSRLRQFPGARIAERIDEVVLQLHAQPITDEGVFVNEKDKIVKFRSCMLPFGRKGKVTHVVMGLSWKVF